MAHLVVSSMIGGFMRTDVVRNTKRFVCVLGVSLMMLGMSVLPSVVEAKTTTLTKKTPKKDKWLDRLSVEVPLQVNLVGLSFGIQPELLFRPISAGSGFHLRAAIGFFGGPELFHIAPLALGIRYVFLRGWRVQPFLGLGVVWQAFLPYDHASYHRIDMTLELGVRGAITRGFAVGVNLSPEFGLAHISSYGIKSTFGLGMAGRLTLTKDLPW